MKAICKKPGEPAEVVDIENSLEALQEAVGGHLESFTFAVDACVLCDEDGRWKGYPHNTVICGVEFAGPILIVGVAGEDFTDLKAPERVLDMLWPKS